MACTTPLLLHGPLRAGTLLTVADIPGVLGVSGRWYRVQTTVDVWGRSRTTHRRQPGLVRACAGCGQTLWFHDLRGCWCETCCAQRRTARTPAPAQRIGCCVQCSAPHPVRRTTWAYCSSACRQAAYRQRQAVDDAMRRVEFLAGAPRDPPSKSAAVNPSTHARAGKMQKRT